MLEILLHAKVEISPELVNEIVWFLTECAKRTDTIIFLGNHDLNLANTGRLDVVSPIVNLSTTQIHHLDENGLYRCKNILFSHMIFLAMLMIM